MEPFLRLIRCKYHKSDYQFQRFSGDNGLETEDAHSCLEYKQGLIFRMLIGK